MRINCIRSLMTLWVLTAGIWANTGFAETEHTTTFNAGLTLTDGNSDTLRANAGLKYEGEKEALGSIRAGVEGNYGESTVDGKEETDIENASAFVDTRKTITERSYGYFHTSAAFDEQALVDYRLIIGPGLGAILYASDTTELTAELGPSYLWEEVDGITDHYLAIRLAERFTHQFSASSTIWQSIEYLPKAENLDAYLLHTEVGVSAMMTTRLALRIVLKSAYDSEPAEDREKHDLMLISGINLSL